jgi:multiple sugar transport system ATP-binding protein
MASVEIRDVTKSFGATQVIRGVSMSIADGEFVVLVGPSGCGKSTILRMIAGLETVTSGEILVDGRVVNDVAPKNRDMAMVFQHYALYPHLTVARNLGFALKLSGMGKSEVDRRVAEVAETLGLTELLDRSPRQLSGGQRQRVAMGRAIIRKPRVFLFDEPLSNLDAKLRVQMRTEIKELHERLRTTIIYVTHDQIEAMTMAHRIVVMRDGIVEQTGAPLELYDHPANLFVAGFIGSPAMNFLKGRADAGRFVADGVAFPIGALPAGSAGRAVVAGIRPEHLQIAPTGFPATVVMTEPTGSEVLVGVRAGKQELLCLFRERLSFTRGQAVTLAPLPGMVHLFHAASGARLTA